MSCPLRIMFGTSMPTNVEAAKASDLTPRISRVCHLMKQWPCSMMLFKYFRLTISIGIGQPKLLSILLIAFRPVVLEALLAITIDRGNSLTSSIRAKNFVAPGLLRAETHKHAAPILRCDTEAILHELS